MIRSKPTVLLLMCALFLSGAAVGIGLLTSSPSPSESPLEGITLHDFGDIEYQGVIMKLSHDFKLVNAGTQTIRILGITSTCGCTTGTASRDVVKPGQTVVIPAVLRVAKPGESLETLWLHIDSFGNMPLTIKASAKGTQTVRVQRRAVRLAPRTPSQITIAVTDRDSDLPPREITIRCPENVVASIGDWMVVFPKDVEKGDRPARWEAVLEISQKGDEPLSIGSSLTLLWGEEQIAELDLTGRAWK